MALETYVERIIWMPFNAGTDCRHGTIVLSNGCSYEICHVLPYNGIEHYTLGAREFLTLHNLLIFLVPGFERRYQGGQHWGRLIKPRSSVFDSIHNWEKEGF